MATNELARREDDDDLGLDSQQILALERLNELGGEPAPMGDNGKPMYSSDPKIRAYQLIFEGRFAGKNRGQGRPRKQRAGEVMAEHIREQFTGKMIKAVN